MDPIKALYRPGGWGEAVPCWILSFGNYPAVNDLPGTDAVIVLAKKGDLLYCALHELMIADLPDGSEHHSPEQIERMLVLQERATTVQEQRLEIDRQHNEMHLRGVAHQSS